MRAGLPGRPAGQVRTEVRPHPLGVDLEVLEAVAQPRRGRPGRRAAARADGPPLGVPGPAARSCSCAMRGQQRRDQPGCALRGGGPGADRGDRVVLVRHRRRAAAARDALAHLADLGLREQDDVAGDLAATPAAAPSAPARSATGVRSVCHGSTGSASPSSAASAAERRPAPCRRAAASVPAAPPSWSGEPRRRTAASRSAAPSSAGQPAGGLQPERRRHAPAAAASARP